MQKLITAFIVCLALVAPVAAIVIVNLSPGIESAMANEGSLQMAQRAPAALAQSEAMRTTP